MLEHDTVTPDVETAGEGYARRFSGEVGAYFLEVQDAAARALLAPSPPPARRPRALDVGGGHAQLTPLLLACGYEVWVQGSRAACADRLAPLRGPEGRRPRFVASSLWSLPFPDRSFDLVVGIRLLAHVERWQALLAEMARVCRHRLVVEYPPLASANALEPLLFRLKRRVEGNTRPYFCYSARRLARTLAPLGFERFAVEKEFFVPMVVHRALGRRALSEALEGAGRRAGLTRLLGSPALLLAERPAAGGPAPC